jgi:hypothetical protein
METGKTVWHALIQSQNGRVDRGGVHTKNFSSYKK